MDFIKEAPSWVQIYEKGSIPPGHRLNRFSRKRVGAMEPEKERWAFISWCGRRWRSSVRESRRPVRDDHTGEYLDVLAQT